jgi:hypothetical protein
LAVAGRCIQKVSGRSGRTMHFTRRNKRLQRSHWWIQAQRTGHFRGLASAAEADAQRLRNIPQHRFRRRRRPPGRGRHPPHRRPDGHRRSGGSRWPGRLRPPGDPINLGAWLTSRPAPGASCSPASPCPAAPPPRPTCSPGSHRRCSGAPDGQGQPTTGQQQPPERDGQAAAEDPHAPPGPPVDQGTPVHAGIPVHTGTARDPGTPVHQMTSRLVRALAG